jgi:hypothetical protein
VFVEATKVFLGCLQVIHFRTLLYVYLMYVWGSATVLVLWIVVPCGLISKSFHFGGIFCFHLQPWNWRRYVAPNSGICL